MVSCCCHLRFTNILLIASYRLINYTPQATVVRLLTIDAVNAYLTLTALSLAGGFEDPRLMLPGWISIATVSAFAAPLSLPIVHG